MQLYSEAGYNHNWTDDTADWELGSLPPLPPATRLIRPMQRYNGAWHDLFRWTRVALVHAVQKARRPSIDRCTPPQRHSTKNEVEWCQLSRTAVYIWTAEMVRYFLKIRLRGRWTVCQFNHPPALDGRCLAGYTGVSRVWWWSLDHVARRDSTQQNCFVEFNHTYVIERHCSPWNNVVLVNIEQNNENATSRRWKPQSGPRHTNVMTAPSRAASPSSSWIPSGQAPVQHHPRACCTT